MSPSSPTPSLRSPQSLGANHPSRVRRHGSPLSWPEGLLKRFIQDMERHGRTVDLEDMQSDARYALAQLLAARQLGDPALAVMSEALFRCFEELQSGLSHSAH